MSNPSTFQKVRNFLQKLCSFNSRKNKKVKLSKKYSKEMSILIPTQSYNYKPDQFKFCDDTYFDEDNIK